MLNQVKKYILCFIKTVIAVLHVDLAEDFIK